MLEPSTSKEGLHGMLELVIRRGDREVERYVLPEGVTTLGRADSNTIILDDGSVSRKHARIVVTRGECFLEDLGSGNGTWRADVRVNRVKLENGDRFTIDPFAFEIHRRAATQSAPETRPVDERAERARSRGEGGRMADRAIERTSSSGKVMLPAREPGGSAASGPRLVLANGSVSFVLLGDAIVIGRADDATISLSDPAVSRRHASLSRDDGKWILRDEKSAHGTLVNGEPVESALLRDGDVVTVGDTELVFRDPPVAAEVDETQIPITNPVPLERTETAAEPIDQIEIPHEAPAANRPVALYVVATLVVVLAIGAIALKTKPGDPAPKLDNVQSITLRTMRTLAQEGAQASKDAMIDTALDRFSRVVTFADSIEMRAIGEAQSLKRDAVSAIHTLREARVVATLQEMNRRRAQMDSQTRKQVTELRSALQDALSSARGKRSLSSYDRAVAALEKLVSLGEDESAELERVRGERASLAREQQGAAIAQLERNGKRRFENARILPRTAAGWQRAIREYESIIAADARRLTSWPSDAEREIQVARGELKKLAAPHKQAAAAALAKQEWIEARSRLESALAIDAHDPATRADLARADAECTKSAIAHLQQARVYEESDDVKNALDSIAQVQRYARRGSKEWNGAEDLKRKIGRNSQ